MPGRRAGVADLLAVLTLTLTTFVLTGPASAQTPSPIGGDLHAFPGAFAAPATAQSAGLAFADRWLGDAPFDNPAVSSRGAYGLTGMLLRANRQDLRVGNRAFDEQELFVDFGGGYVSLPAGSATFSAWAFQPVLRLEENAFQRGEPGSPVEPGAFTTGSSSRELRAGIGASIGGGGLRLGAAGEYTRRTDHYETSEISGSPDQGFRRVEFEGDALGVAAGLRFGEDRPEAGAIVIGVGGRLIAELELEGEQRLELLSGDSTRTFDATRESRVDGGVSASVRATPALRLVAGFGGHTGGEWTGLSGPDSEPVSTGTSTLGAFGLEFHDERDPWTVRIGYALESEEDAPEERSGAIGIGIGWAFERSMLEFGVLHRMIDRDGRPKSYDDRMAITFRGTF